MAAASTDVTWGCMCRRGGVRPGQGSHALRDLAVLAGGLLYSACHPHHHIAGESLTSLSLNEANAVKKEFRQSILSKCPCGNDVVAAYMSS